MATQGRPKVRGRWGDGDVTHIVGQGPAILVVKAIWINLRQSKGWSYGDRCSISEVGEGEYNGPPLLRPPLGNVNLGS